MISAIAVALALCTPAAHAAPHPLAGVWKIRYPWHLEVENGVVKPTMETGKLTVEARGDSLIATLVADPTPESPRPRPRRLAASLGSTEAVFVAREQVTLTMPAGERLATAVSTWILKPDGDQLGGSLERRLEGVDGQGLGPQPLTGSRIRS